MFPGGCGGGSVELELRWNGVERAGTHDTLVRHARAWPGAAAASNEYRWLQFLAGRLSGVATIRDAVGLIRWHHERLDGKGYTDGLRGDDIALLVRILSVCDVYDSLASERPYRAPIPHPLCLKPPVGQERWRRRPRSWHRVRGVAADRQWRSRRSGRW